MYPIVQTKTKDGLKLAGMIFETKIKETILIHIHGTAGNFYENTFIQYFAKNLPKENVAFLSTNNRGSGELSKYPLIGASCEIFEESILDIDAWIKFAIDKGYKNIILQGHSLGTEKLVYYLNHGKYRNKINACILLGFADSVGTQKLFLKSQKNISRQDLLQEAKKLIDQGFESEFLKTIWLSNCGETPMSAKSYQNFFKENSELSKALPFHKAKLEYFANINLPILAIIGDQKEYTYISIKKAIDLLKASNSSVKTIQLKNCSHNFENCEIDLLNEVVDFIGDFK